MKIFFDFDGTLVDSRERLYRLFQYLVPSSSLTFESYWVLKRSKISHREILSSQFSYSEAEITFFEKNWMEKIESPEWLHFDKPFDGVSTLLEELKKTQQIFLVTARQFEKVTIDQIAKYGWTDFFEKVFVTSQQQEKVELLNKGQKLKSNDWLVGDTGKDIETGKLLGIKTAAVLSGFLNKEKLLEYHPDIIVDKVTDLKFE